MSRTAAAGSAPGVLTPAYYERLYALEEGHGWFRGMRSVAGAYLEPFAHQARGWRILDLGCGTGGMLTWLRRFAGATVVGIDLSPRALALSRHRGHTALVEGTAIDLPFPDQSFDLVVSTDVLQHLPDVPDSVGSRSLLSESHRVLRRGGHLYLRTNTAFGVGNGAATVEASYRRFSRTELCERLLTSGFAVERISHANCLPSLVAIVRGWRRGAGDGAVGPAGRSGPGYTGLTVRVRPRSRRWVDAGLALLLRAEAYYLRAPRRSLPFGHALVALARKPETAGA